ncbi:MAG TPA: zinc metalloprotease HtpX [Elusimicrobia bacterium]|nr:zinc metalloprotease HtpX [Elusimicrobiota bacterium]HBW23194.1 zinc metalloprotease HtpX [Elusimicrobiota bacterium]
MNIYEQQARNRRMTWAVMFVFVVFFLAIGLGFDFFYLRFTPLKTLGYGWNAAGYYDVSAASQPVPFGTIAALLIGLGMAANSMLNGRGMVLRSTLARRAVSADEKERQFLNVVAEMATASGLQPPEAYVVPDQDLNAFATGTSPRNSVIAVTEGLLKSLNREELQAVVAHEMSHIRNYDMRLMTVAAALMGAIALLSDLAGRTMRPRYGSLYGRAVPSRSSSGGRKGGGIAMLLIFIAWLLLVVLAPLISRLLAMAISREREYLADASGAELTRNPLALVSALEKIRNAVTPTYAINNGVAHMCIADPRGSLIEEKMGLAADLFATHPPMEKRILALKVMAYQAERQGRG